MRIFSTKRNKAGFTLIELIVVIAVLGILVGIATPRLYGYTQKSKEAVDIANVKILNDVTSIYKTDNEAGYVNFAKVSTTDATRMTSLVASGYISEAIKAQQTEKEFQWNSTNEIWEVGDGSFTLSSSNVTFKELNGYYASTLNSIITSGKTSITIPKTINGITITQIYQDASKNLGLTSVKFATDSGIIQLHARSFKDNALTEIVLPTSIKTIDYGAFMNNNLTKIVIGSGVTIASKAFDPIKINNVNVEDVFNNAYAAGGAGTYLLVNGTWVKQTN